MGFGVKSVFLYFYFYLYLYPGKLFCERLDPIPMFGMLQAALEKPAGRLFKTQLQVTVLSQTKAVGPNAPSSLQPAAT
jgi:hypothetical protein